MKTGYFFCRSFEAFFLFNLCCRSLKPKGLKFSPTSNSPSITALPLVVSIISGNADDILSPVLEYS